MQDVIKHGTGVRFETKVRNFAAKTGTAQLIKNSGRSNENKALNDHSWFIGFTVKNQPDFSIVVLIENENNAIKIASQIVNQYFEDQKLAP